MLLADPAAFRVEPFSCRRPASVAGAAHRATQLLGVSALAASFLGLAHPATGQAFGVWGWFAIAAFVVTKALTP
jgi:hypothetical protein